jgi:hypothetical protein
MDTLKDWQTLEEMVEQGRMPWRVSSRARSGNKLSVAAL